MQQMDVQRKLDEPSVVAREDMELSLFVIAMKDYFGYDFSNYQKSSLKRRVFSLVDYLHLSHISELIPKIFHDDGFLETVIFKLSVGVTELFRDPWVYAALNDQVLPTLKTWPNLRVWHAGCSTGEEVYSLAITLKEANLLSNATLFATDFNTESLKSAKSGILKNIITKEYVENYQQSGGSCSLVDYFTSSYGSSKLNRELLAKMNFEQHNLAHDGVFISVQLVLCRNVLIYFNTELQNKALCLLSDSLVRGGFLVLGTKESLMGSAIEKQFKVIDRRASIYQKLV